MEFATLIRKTENLIKRFVPYFALRVFRRWKLARLGEHFSKLDSASTFDKIYREGLWKVGKSGALSGEGTTGNWADSAISDIEQIINGLEGLTICDVGCGDFVFGQRIAGLFTRYHAIDISNYIIEINKEKYSHLSNVEFHHGNGSDESLPVADVYLIRQVLQHTTNAQIEKTVSNVFSKTPKLVICFEDVPIKDYVPNSDLPTDGSFTRNTRGSGVDLIASPFNFPFQVFSETPHPENSGTKLVCYVYSALDEGGAEIENAK